MKVKNIDFIKGFLILLVITGHLLQGTISENLPRYIIYSFHMPIFIAISGYLISSSKLIHSSAWFLVRKYFWRVIIPWVLAVLIYFIVINGRGILSLSFRVIPGKLISSFFFPFYHLWYIPAFLSWIFISFILIKMNLSLKKIFLFSILVSALFIMLENHLIYPESHLLQRIIEILLHTFRPYFYCFFILGMILRNYELNFSITACSILLFVFGLATIILFFYTNAVLQVIAANGFDFCLIYLLIKLSKNDSLPKNNIIEWIGLNSLAIYLWHVIPILLLKEILGTNNLLLFYSIGLLLELILIFSVYCLSKIDFINSFCFGINKKLI